MNLKESFIVLESKILKPGWIHAKIIEKNSDKVFNLDIKSDWLFHKGEEIFINDEFQLHNENGPALINVLGLRYYSLKGKSYTKEYWEEEISKQPEIDTEYFLQFEKTDPPSYISRLNPLKVWYDKDVLYHRDNDLPASIFEGGPICWWKHGKRHRDGDKPAVIDGPNKLWYKEGKKHRLTGPAVIWGESDVEYWIEGIKYSKEEWEKKVSELENTNAFDTYKEYDFIISKDNNSTVNILNKIEERLSALEKENQSLQDKIAMLEMEISLDKPFLAVEEKPKSDTTFLLGTMALSAGINLLTENKTKKKSKRKTQPKEEVIILQENVEKRNN